MSSTGTIPNQSENLIVETPPPARYHDWSSSAQSLLTTIIIAIFVITFIVQAFQIPSESMENTLLIGDYLLVDKVRYGGNNFWSNVLPYRTVRRGDIIVFHYPINPSEHFVKRVVAVPGDRLRLVNGVVYVNGVVRREEYAHYSATSHDAFRDDFPKVNVVVPDLEGAWWEQMKKLVEDNQLIVPEDNYFVLGDNRDESKDSRYWGFVPAENIVGRPLIIYWSIKTTSSDTPGQDDVGDRLSKFGYAATHIFSITRWDRAFRIVR